MDEKKRLIARAISWQIAEAMAVFAIALLVSRLVVASLVIAVLAAVTKALFFYLHETLWLRFSQRAKKLEAPDYQI